MSSEADPAAVQALMATRRVLVGAATRGLEERGDEVTLAEPGHGPVERRAL